MELEILKWIIMVLMGVGGWLMRNTIEQTQKDLREMKVELDKKLPKDDFREFKTELREMFNEIKMDIREIKSSSHGSQQ